jgi:betaine-aldehyde dehydrogenase
MEEAPVSARVLRNFVGGRFVDTVDGATSKLVDPVTGEVFAEAPVAGAADVDAAMRAAATAFESSPPTPPR